MGPSETRKAVAEALDSFLADWSDGGAPQGGALFPVCAVTADKIASIDQRLHGRLRGTLDEISRPPDADAWAIKCLALDLRRHRGGYVSSPAIQRALASSRATA